MQVLVLQRTVRRAAAARCGRLLVARTACHRRGVVLAGARQSTAFRSTTRRFKPPPRRLSQSELDAAPQQQDQRAWKRAGWHQSNAPRLHTSTLPRPLTADLDPADPPPSNNVAAAVQPLQQAMANGQQKPRQFEMDRDVRVEDAELAQARYDSNVSGLDKMFDQAMAMKNKKL